MFESCNKLNHKRSGGLIQTTNSRSLDNTQNSVSHERLFYNGNIDLYKENILPMPEAQPKKSLIRKDRSGEIAASHQSIARLSNDKLESKSSIKLQQEGYQKDINEFPGNKRSKKDIDSSLAAIMNESKRGSPQFVISPRQDGSKLDLDTQLGTTNKGTSTGPNEHLKQQLQHTHFQIPLPKNLLENTSINQRAYEHQLAQNFRKKMQGRFGATTAVFSPKKGAIEKLKGIARNDPNMTHLSVATKELPGLAGHRFSVAAPSEAKSKKSHVFSSERPILAHEVSVGSGTTNTNLRNSIILETKPLYSTIDPSDQQQSIA